MGKLNDSEMFAATSTDATGLIPSVATNREDAEAYRELYPYLPPVPPATLQNMVNLPGALVNRVDKPEE